jgi:hypothetical protein
LLLYPVLAGMAASTLASCASEPPKPKPPVVAAPAPIVVAPRPHVPRPAHKPEAPSETGEPDEAATAPTTAMAAPGVAEPPPTPQAEELIGLDEDGTARLLGKASEETAEPPAQVWRYKTGFCELDLFFYYDLRSGRMRTLRYDFKGEAADKARQEDCMKALAAGGRA